MSIHTKPTHPNALKLFRESKVLVSPNLSLASNWRHLQKPSLRCMLSKLTEINDAIAIRVLRSWWVSCHAWLVDCNFVPTKRGRISIYNLLCQKKKDYTYMHWDSWHDLHPCKLKVKLLGLRFKIKISCWKSMKMLLEGIILHFGTPSQFSPWKKMLFCCRFCPSMLGQGAISYQNRWSRSCARFTHLVEVIAITLHDLDTDLIAKNQTVSVRFFSKKMMFIETTFKKLDVFFWYPIMLGLGKLFDDAPAPSRPLSSCPLGDPWAAMAGTAYKSLRYPSISHCAMLPKQRTKKRETIYKNDAQKEDYLQERPLRHLNAAGEARKLWPDWRLQRFLKGHFLFTKNVPNWKRTQGDQKSMAILFYSPGCPPIPMGRNWWR